MRLGEIVLMIRLNKNIRKGFSIVFENEFVCQTAHTSQPPNLPGDFLGDFFIALVVGSFVERTSTGAARF